MFRRPGKNPLEATAVYKEEPQFSSSYKYGVKKSEPYSLDSHNNVPPRTFDHHPQQSPSIASVLESREEHWKAEKTSPLTHHFQGMAKEEPETTLGEGVTFRGQLSFERLLRIDGEFEGELLSQGKVIIGPKGVVKTELLKLREAIIEGTLEGNIEIQEKLELRAGAIVKGDIKAKIISVEAGAQIIGKLEILPLEN